MNRKIIIRGKKRIKKLKHPPEIEKYCYVCEKKTLFKYNPNLLHSECMECGAR